jgi:uncharacterized protein
MRSKVITSVSNSLLASVVVLSLSPAFAQIPDKPTGYVTDLARVISIDDVKLLESRCRGFDQTHRAQIALVTIPSLKGEPIEKAALDLFRKWGIGRKGVDDGLLLLLSVGDRQSRLTVGYGMERTINTATAASILRTLQPDLRAGRYAAALNAALDSLEKLLPIAK